MAKKRRRQARRNAREAAVLQPTPFRIRHRKTELDDVARKITETVSLISNSRNGIRSYEQALRNERETLSNLMTEHERLIGRFRELSTIPQPVA